MKKNKITVLPNITIVNLLSIFDNISPSSTQDPPSMENIRSYNTSGLYLDFHFFVAIMMGPDLIGAKRHI